MMASIVDFANCELNGDEDFDLKLFAITGESRCWQLPELYRRSSGPAWVLKRQSSYVEPLALDAAVEERLRGARTMTESSFVESLSRLFSQVECENVRVMLDVTCMPRVDMAWVVDALVSEATYCGKELDLVIGYVLAQYSEPPTELAANESIKPVLDRFAGWPDDATGATSLIVGLGYEPGKASGACEFFDATEVWVFSPTSPLREYDDAILSSNRAVIERATRNGRYLTYPVDSPASVLSQLLILVGDQLRRSNPVILPFGPKIFFALSLAVSVHFPAFGVWHMTGDRDLPDHDHLPSDKNIGLRIRFAAVGEGAQLKT